MKYCTHVVNSNAIFQFDYKQIRSRGCGDIGAEIQFTANNEEKQNAVIDTLDILTVRNELTLQPRHLHKPILLIFLQNFNRAVIKGGVVTMT